MNTQTSVGIWGIGTYLPPIVRKNDHWPAHVVAGWRKKPAPPAASSAEPEMPMSEGHRLVAQAMMELANDPFGGATERRVIDPEMKVSEMETLAARDAIAKAGVDPSEIDFVLSFSFCPDHLNLPNACLVHHNLGLPKRCFSLAVEAACNSFHLQMALCEQMIRGGQARVGLLIQSSTFSRLAPMEEPFSAWFGDGATAQIVGPVASGRGVIGRAHRTDGSLSNALLTGIPGKHWYEDGRVVIFNGDKKQARMMLMSIPEMGLEVVSSALQEAGLGPKDVDFYASHQATPWFRRVSQEYAGLDRAKFVDTFPWAGSISASNIPLVLAVGEREGLLRPGDVVATYSGGTGITYSSLAMRWGR